MLFGRRALLVDKGIIFLEESESPLHLRSSGVSILRRDKWLHVLLELFGFSYGLVGLSSLDAEYSLNFVCVPSLSLTGLWEKENPTYLGFAAFPTTKVLALERKAPLEEVFFWENSVWEFNMLVDFLFI